MTDIVVVLRALSLRTIGEEAASEIERLRKALTEAAERLEARGHNFGAREARAALNGEVGGAR